MRIVAIEQIRVDLAGRARVVAGLVDVLVIFLVHVERADRPVEEAAGPRAQGQVLAEVAHAGAPGLDMVEIADVRLVPACAVLLLVVIEELVAGDRLGHRPGQFPVQIEVVKLGVQLEVARIVLRHDPRIGVGVEDVLLFGARVLAMGDLAGDGGGEVIRWRPQQGQLAGSAAVAVEAEAGNVGGGGEAFMAIDLHRPAQRQRVADRHIDHVAGAV